MGEWVDVKVSDGAFRAYVARPSAEPKAAVVVLQEIFGVNAVMRGKTDWLASEGFLAVCPDLFWRIEPGIDITDKTQAEMDRAFELFGAFDQQKGLGDIQATIDLTRQMGPGKVGAMGYCLGGLMAYLTACHTDSDASVGYYGVSIDQRLSEASGIKKPLLLHVAGKDGFVPPPAQQAMHQGLDANPLVTLIDYPERDHAFAREGGANYDASDAARADAQTIAFFKEKLA